MSDYAYLYEYDEKKVLGFWEKIKNKTAKAEIEEKIHALHIDFNPEEFAADPFKKVLTVLDSFDEGAASLDDVNQIIFEYLGEKRVWGYSHEFDFIVSEVISFSEKKTVKCSFAEDSEVLKSKMINALNTLPDQEKKKLVGKIFQDQDRKYVFNELVQFLKVTKKNNTSSLYYCGKNGWEKRYTDLVSKIQLIG